MGGAVDLEDLVRAAVASLDDALEVALFGDGDPAAVAGAIEALCAEHLAPVDHALMYRAGVGAVAGLRLVDGRDVLVKVHRVRADLERLRAVVAVQAHLAERGLPAPRPLLAPTALGAGVATVEEYVVGESADAHDPSTRAELAAVLHRLTAVARPLTTRHDVGTPLLVRPPGAPLYPEPHSLRFDFEATNEGAEWIDELARLGRRRLDRASGEPVIGHHDWRIENVAFRGGAISAIYDWDSLGIAPEPIVVGIAAAAFCVDWSHQEPDPLPTLEEMRAFVEDYEHARGAAFTPAEREVLDAANLALVAYGSRCLHSDATFHPELLPDGPRSIGWFRLLEERGADGLTR